DVEPRLGDGLPGWGRGRAGGDGRVDPQDAGDAAHACGRIPASIGDVGPRARGGWVGGGAARGVVGSDGEGGAHAGELVADDEVAGAGDLDAEVVPAGEEVGDVVGVDGVVVTDD